MMTPPAMCNTASSFSLEKNRSATIPIKKGLMIAAIAVAPYAVPICVSVKCRVVPRYVPIVTNHDPQTKYWRNIMIDSRQRPLDAATAAAMTRTMMSGIISTPGS